MAIYPDKKDGKLTGRFRVELQRGKERYRKRWDSLAQAQQDEKAVLASWAAGEALPGPGAAVGAPEVHTLSSVIPLAKGMLWAGMDSESGCWQHMAIMETLLGRNLRLDDIDTHTVDGLIKKLKALGKADGTVNRYLSHLKTFLTWAQKRKYRVAPVSEIEFSWREESVGRIRWITVEEEQALGAFLTGRDHPKAQQAHAVWKLIQVAIATGCRRDELLTVEPGQINGNRLHLWKTKTDTPRTVPMSDHTRDLLLDLLQSGTMPTRRGLRTWWERAREHMGLAEDENFVFHACRHTCATRMVDADINVFVIKEWMGHKVIETTLRYAHVKPQNLEDALVKVGNYAPSAGQNPQFSAGFQLPPPSPTGGAYGHFSRAA
ncbi:site-specific integrase [Sphingomonas sp. BK580]|uniref:tyrosine-type recombinase/integrase n=1 Tax=Sphingomonas sp. BK580 TaxID=2586972 RepID=UPI001620EBA2|nr:site-specific integrase [Sphingomonas sp. BK580]MBB3692992.1 integrase [Sphingomonas sp. BK580]